MKKIMTLIFLVVIGGAFYVAYDYYQQSNIPIADQTLIVKNVPLYIEGDNTLKQKEVDDLIEFMNEEIPESLLMNAQGIHFMSAERFCDGNTTGLAQSSNMHIYIKLSSNSNPKKTIVHELFHVLDYNHGYSDYAQITNAYQENPTQFGEYGATNVREFLAEGGKKYFFDSYLFDKKVELQQFLNEKGLVGDLF